MKKTLDGNAAASYIAYGFSEVCGLYPITPSSVMGELVEKWASENKRNIFGNVVDVLQMQSEAGAAGAVHGALSGGAFASTFTSSQGLLLMIPNMYKIAGELQPCVFHVAARALAAQALSIFGDHQDVMATRATGFCMLASNSPQEAHDMALIAHLSSIKASLPFLHFFDGFRTSHEIQKIDILKYDEIAKLTNEKDLLKHRKKALNPKNPHLRGTAQNPDIYFQLTQSSQGYYDRAVDVVEEQMKIVSKLTNRSYNLFDYVGHENATKVIVMMGSGAETTQEVVEHLVEKHDEKVGLIKVRLFRPFSAKHLLEKLPKTVSKIAVLDRTKEMGAFCQPLHLDVLASINTNMSKNDIKIVGGIYGLGGKEFSPKMVKAVFDNLDRKEPKNNFTVGIDDDVTHSSLDLKSEKIKNFTIDHTDEYSCVFYGLGGDGTVGANKDAVKILGDNTKKNVQAYFSYDSKKAGSLTISYLRFKDSEIKSTYVVEKANFLACHHPMYLYKYDMLQSIKNDGIFLLNTSWTFNEIEKHLPATLKKTLIEKNIKFFTIDANEIAKKFNLGKFINNVMQSAFFKLTKIIPFEEVLEYLKKAIETTYSKKGQKVVDANNLAVEKTSEYINEITKPSSWNDIAIDEKDQNILSDNKKPDFVKNIADVMNKNKGDTLPVSAFTPGGFFPLSTTKYEKRNISQTAPKWNPEDCIQCNKCSLVCPHGGIRPFYISDDDAKKAPKSLEFLEPIERKAKGVKYTLSASPKDCTGCEKCVIACPKNCLKMVDKSKDDDTVKNWDFLINAASKKSSMNRNTIKGSQFKKPLLEFSGACAGCTQTIYMKLLTQLYGEKLIIANATGCSSIWGGSAPSIPWTTNEDGHGPAWANSLFEDNAEYGLGIKLGIDHRRRNLNKLIKDALRDPILNSDEKLKTLKESLELYADPTGAEDPLEYKDFLYLLESNKTIDSINEIYQRKDLLEKPSVWIVGGDGWAYDIGFSGVDHVLHTNEDVNLLVLDTETYSNTGGQASKATPIGAIAKFANKGKKTPKKDLGFIAMTYGSCYVAAISIEADPKQAIKAFKEAKNFNGPSIIIAFCACISHGIKGGLKNSEKYAKDAINTGYWINYRYNPNLEKPLTIDSNPPTEKIDDFLNIQNRFTSLVKQDPVKAKELQNVLKEQLEKRMELFKNLENK
jgi:pyruvate-ferredoxin/flavodoxin oxidoreductase